MIEHGETPHEGVQERIEAKELVVFGDVLSGDDGALGCFGFVAAGFSGVGVVEGNVEEFGEEAVVGTLRADGKAVGEEAFEFAARVARTDVAMPFVGEPQDESETAERGESLDVRYVDNQSPARSQDAVDFVDERVVVGHVLEHVDDDDQIERRVGERERLSVGQVDVGFNEGADFDDGGGVEVGASPGAALLAQEMADDAVVGTEIERALACGFADEGVDLAPFGLFEDGLGEES